MKSLLAALLLLGLFAGCKKDTEESPGDKLSGTYDVNELLIPPARGRGLPHTQNGQTTTGEVQVTKYADTAVDYEITIYVNQAVSEQFSGSWRIAKISEDQFDLNENGRKVGEFTVSSGDLTATGEARNRSYTIGAKKR